MTNQKNGQTGATFLWMEIYDIYVIYFNFLPRIPRIDASVQTVAARSAKKEAIHGSKRKQQKR